MGRDVEIAPGGSIEIGAHTTLQDRCIILGDVKIGADCIFAPNIYVSSGRHWFDVEPWSLVRDQDVVARSREESVSSPVTIDEDCWIGTNVVVLAGIRIGRGAVVGANSVITRDVDPYSIVAGAPAREIGRRLEYLPPMRISHDAPRDRPYFYAGFELSNSHAQRNELLGGLVARHQFSISLDSGNGGQVCIRIRASQASGARVRVFAQSASVGRDWGVLRFEVPSSEESRMDFQIFGNDPEVIVDSAWMEPIPP
jgi:carbonic anhydrase/acetyltransferase-like protein (isoleucine patch superfamily)